MKYVLVWPDGTYVVKRDGMNLSTNDPAFATKFASRSDARSAQPGHHSDMGGSGYVGLVMKL